MNSKKSFARMYAAVALGLGATAAPFASSAQQVPVDAGLSRQQQVNQERENKREQQQGDKQERREAKREREQLANMPEGARKALRAETQNAKDVDYYRVEGGDTTAGRGREFGAKFVAANGHQMDVRVDRGGKVVNRQDLTAATAAAAAPAAPAPAPAPADTDVEQLNNMPQAARQALRSDTEQAGVKNVDYYRIEGAEVGGQVQSQFGARFTAANGHQMDVRVDRDGRLVMRKDLTTEAATAAAQTPASAAQQPAPGNPGATAEAPESGNAIYRRLQAAEVPQNIRAVFDKDTAGARNVRYYRTKYGSQLAYEAKWQDAKGQEMRHYVSDAGQTLVRGASNDDDAQTAGANTPATPPTPAPKPDTGIKTGRAELKDLPRAVQTYFSRETDGARDVKFYNTKYGSQQAYRADFKSRDGKERTVILDASGKVLSQKGDDAKKS